MIRRPPRSTRTDTLFPTRRSSDLYDAQGNLVKNVAGANASSSTINPLWNIRESDNDTKNNFYNLNLVGNYKLRSEEHTSELQSLMRISYAVFCLKQKKQQQKQNNST